ncbi:hypothetical protein [Chachezhania antarctica]|uniref:hypothetical protein n=1 Tax=Chachezhania antarctica TaxID=2340860 RepID=UPI000EACD65A|nr:hypothetical protein [Chachezhania antarctica]
MRKLYVPIMAGILFLAGCTELMMDGSSPANVGNLPESVTTIAAPGQDLGTARLRPEDGCYWYEHSGPVEVTLLPLRSTGGNPICTSTTA